MMSWLDVVTAYLGAVASGDARAVNQLVSEDVKYKDGIMELNGIEELLSIVGPDYRMQIQNWAYKNKLVFVEYSYWDYMDQYPKDVVGVYSINDLGKISQIRMYS
ncbi:MAG: nuclear transport factor 2 family protein [Minisyncoccia bacterium]|jgi:limonene-1,2-epoxide hydrolase